MRTMEYYATTEKNKTNLYVLDVEWQPRYKVKRKSKLQNMLPLYLKLFVCLWREY